MKGYLAFVLHAHLPFIRHPEYEYFLEENWFYEALTETYIPLVHMMEGLERDGINYQITMTISPSLLSMMRDNLLQERYLRHIKQLISLTEQELDLTVTEPKFRRLGMMYNHRFENCRHTFEERYDGDISRAFKHFQDQGNLEIITCAATHGFLPMLRNYPEAVRAQIEQGVEHYTESFGRRPRGIWLPECAYYHDLDRILADLNIRYFITESHGVMLADPNPIYELYAPIYTPTGVAAFPRDLESSKQVWSSKEGYPGDPNYRDFYRDVGFDREFDYIKPFIHPDGIRIFTGVKYFAITSETLGNKSPYDPHKAYERADSHAGNFMFNRERQVEYLSGTMDREPIVVCPYDAELFGHWWFEGPLWLDLAIRKMSESPLLELISPYTYLERYPSNQIAQPNASSWGANGYYEVWLNQNNSWIYPHIHAATEYMIELARKFPEADGILRRALNQAARELLLLQSSDWAFIITTGTSVEYAIKRTKVHIARFNKLYHQILDEEIDEAYLRSVEERDTIFPNINYRIYA